MKYSIKNKKMLPDIEFKKEKNSPKLEYLSALVPQSLSHLLTTVAKLETKQSSLHPSFYDTRIHSLVGCAFLGFQ